MSSTSQLRELNDEELARRLVEAKQELFQLRFQVATGKQDNSARLGQVRRDVARVLTLRHERAVADGGAQANAKAKKKKVKR
jgi:large subunit ribosomal protein L29